MQDGNINTKTQIFNTALRLFAENGYENVTVRDIANKVGIKAASIYNHYESKEQILEACYDLWLKNRNNKRLTVEQCEPIIRNGTKEEVLQIIHYDFEENISEKLLFALFVVYSRIYTDTKAKEIFFDEMDDSMRYLEEFFKFGIKIGRLNEFNISAVSYIILSRRVFEALSATIHPDKNSEWYHAQDGLIDELIRIVPFKY